MKLFINAPLRDSGEINASTFGQADAGNILISVKDRLVIDGLSTNGFSGGIFSKVSTGATGNGGNILIQAGSLELLNGGRIDASIFGRGNAGNIKINATDYVSLTGSNISATVEANGIGNGGNIDINTGSIILRDGGRIDASIFGRGNAGNIKINVLDNLILDGISNDGFPGGIASEVYPGSVGNGGDIELFSKNLLITDGSRVSTVTYGIGNAGNLKIFTTGFQELIGVSPDGLFASGFNSSVERGAQGRGGNLLFFARNLQVREGAQISTATFGQGDAGNLEIIGESLLFDGRSFDGQQSGAFSNVGFAGIGNGGDIRIRTNDLSVNNGAQISTANFGKGNAGNLEIIGKSISFNGQSFNREPSGAFSSARFDGGNGGDIRIQTNDLSVNNGAQISTSVGGLIDNLPGGRGNGGNLLIQAAKDFRVANGSIVSVSSRGNGNAGRLEVDAKSRSSNILCQSATCS